MVAVPTTGSLICSPVPELNALIADDSCDAAPAGNPEDTSDVSDCVPPVILLASPPISKLPEGPPAPPRLATAPNAADAPGILFNAPVPTFLTTLDS